jgi:hypothetical protein
MSTTMSPSNFKTTDLALATFLSMHGQSFTLSRDGESERALFVFNPVDDEENSTLRTLVSKYTLGSARVEPSKFMREVGSVRGQLYDFLDGIRPR